MENNPYVRDVHVIGADRELISKLDKEIQDKAKFYDLEDIFDAGTDDIRLPETEYPVYLSIDKDILSEEEVDTNWDQGSLRTEVLLECLQYLIKNYSLIGIDICGEPDPHAPDAEIKKSEKIDRKICLILDENGWAN